MSPYLLGLLALWAEFFMLPLNVEPIEEKPVTETYVVTAYTAGYESTGKHPGDKGYGITASGKHVQEGITIACPPELEFGTKVHIENVGERICYDRGGAIQGKRIDVYMENLHDALEFGKQSLEVQIIEK